MAGKKVEVEKIQVIPVSEGRWAVPSTSQPGVSYEVVEEGGQLVCNCMAGLNGRDCKHRKAVRIAMEQQKINGERRLAGEMVQPKQEGKAKLTKHGIEFGLATSALQKLIRRGDEENAIGMALELYEVAPHYLAKRLLVIASEDVGLADPQTVGLVNQLVMGWTEGKRFSWYMSPHQLIQAVMLLCRAQKSTEVEDAITLTKEKLERGWKPVIPPEAVDMHTQQGKEMAKKMGMSYDEQCRQWYEGRQRAGIFSNKYQDELRKLKPEWFPQPVDERKVREDIDTLWPKEK